MDYQVFADRFSGLSSGQQAGYAPPARYKGYRWNSVQAFSRVKFPAMLQPEVGVLASAILREWPDFRLLVGAGLSAVPAVKLPPAIHLVPPRTIAKPASRPIRAATQAKPAKLGTLPYNGALTPEQRDACLDGLVDTLLDIFLTMSPEQRARYRPKE
jgi:hypothetical protein